MFPYRCETFTTANVSVLNVFKTSVDTINASSITSDMTIGANLNGGSLTLGSANATTSIRGTVNIPSGTINASYFTMFSSVIGGKPTTWLDTIQSNLTPNMHIGFNNASEIYIGSSKTNTIGIGGDAGGVRIANEGLSATGRVNIASGANATGSQVNIGSDSLHENIIKGKTIFINYTTGGNINMGTQSSGLTTILGNTYINSGQFPLRVISNSNNGTRFEPISGQNSRGNIQFHGCFPSLPSDQAPRRVCDIYGGFNGNSWGSEYMAIGVGNNNTPNDGSNPTIEQVRIYTNTITLNRPITPNYSYPVGGGRIGEILEGTMSEGLIAEGGIISRISVSSSGVWHFSWNIQFVLINATYMRPDFHIYGVTSFNIQVSSMPGQSSYYMMTGSYISHVDSGPYGHGTIYMNYAFSGWNPYAVYGNFRAVRIA